MNILPVISVHPFEYTGYSNQYRLRFPCSFEYFYFMHPLPAWFSKCLQSNHLLLWLRNVTKVVYKAQETSSGFGVSRWQLRIINLKSHAGFGDQTHDFINVCHGTNRLKSPNLFRCCLDRNWFIPLNSLVSLSIHFLFLPKYYSCELYKLIHNINISLTVSMFFSGVVSWVLHQEHWANQNSCYSGKDIFEDFIPSIAQFESRQRTSITPYRSPFVIW